MPIVKVNSERRMRKIQCAASLLAVVVSIFFCSAAVVAQSVSPKRSSPQTIPNEGGKKNPDDDTPLTTFEEEMRAKRAIKMAEKDHQENLDRAREIQTLGKQLKESLQGKSTLDRDDLKKVDRLEKLTKKVRGEAGGESEEMTIVNPPTDLPSAACQIAEKTEALSKEVQNTPRQVISASVISSANLLLELIRIARTFGRPQQATQQP